MKLTIAPGTTSRTVRVFIQDSSSTTGSGLTGLVFGSAGLTAYYIREGDASPTVVTLVTATVGTWTSKGFKEIDATNMPGWYEIGLPNAAIAAGAADVGVHLKGATNMAPLPLEIQLQSDWKEVLEDTLTAEQMLRIVLAAVAGKTTDGGIKFRDVADGKDRITATVDGSGNRTAITLDGS